MNSFISYFRENKEFENLHPRDKAGRFSVKRESKQEGIPIKNIQKRMSFFIVFLMLILKMSRFLVKKIQSIIVLPMH